MSYSLRAVVVGIDKYSDRRYQQISRLQCARNDAQAIESVLRSSDNAYHLESLRLLRDEEANERAVRHAVDTHIAPRGFERNAIALFYFAGHGVLKDGRVYLCCHDVDFASPEHGGIRLNNVYEWLTEGSAECAIAIIDACFSGGLTNDVLDYVTAVEHARRAFQDIKARDGKTIAIFTACESSQQAREDLNLKHGLFTYQFLRGLRDGEAVDQDGEVTLSGLGNYLLKSFDGKEQKPQINLRSSASIPLRKGLLPARYSLAPLPDKPVRPSVPPMLPDHSGTVPPTGFVSQNHPKLPDESSSPTALDKLRKMNQRHERNVAPPRFSHDPQSKDGGKPPIRSVSEQSGHSIRLILALIIVVICFLLPCIVFFITRH
jgi:Caspase domain